ncbi:MAG: dephospho-CoA kinase [Limisphaerales bacterium]
MKLFGITGGVGMGKSTCGQLLIDRGVMVCDTDLIARQLVEPGRPALEEIRQRFGPSLFSDDGNLRRSQLARLVFADAAARADLEAILHPRIREIWQEKVDSWRAAGNGCGAVIIPLLFETKAEAAFDAVICIACTEASRWQRLRQRGWSNGDIRRRIEAQMPTDQKIVRSSFLVWTEGALPTHAAQLDRILSYS